MIKQQDSSDAVWDAASVLTPQAQVTVRYNSSRSDKRQSMSGVVSSVHFEGPNLVIQFERDDDQTLKLVDSGWLLSVGSSFPRTGVAEEVDVMKPGDVLPTTFWLE